LIFLDFPGRPDRLSACPVLPWPFQSRTTQQPTDPDRGSLARVLAPWPRQVQPGRQQVKPRFVQSLCSTPDPPVNIHSQTAPKVCFRRFSSVAPFPASASKNVQVTKTPSTVSQPSKRSPVSCLLTGQTAAADAASIALWRGPQRARPLTVCSFRNAPARSDPNAASTNAKLGATASANQLMTF